MERQESHFTNTEITEALADVGLDAQTQQAVLDGLQRQAEQRRQERREDTWRRSMVRFAVLYERATANNASSSNIEGWYEDSLMQAEELLWQFEGRTQLAEAEEAVRLAAALHYTYASLEYGSDVNEDLLTRAGVSPQNILNTFHAGIAAALVAAGLDKNTAAAAVSKHHPTLNSLDGRLDIHHWPHIVQPAGAIMRARLIAAGHVLPELNGDGAYDGEEEDTFSI